MYTYYSKQQAFETFVLEDKDSNTYIEVVPERGAIISKYVYHGKDIFYLDQATLEDSSKNIRGGNPILFPISSYLKDETYHYEGHAYQLKQHGFARQLPAKVIELQANEQHASITLEIVHQEETLQRYPFQFSLIMKYTLDKKGLHIQAEVTNKDTKTMPYYLGYHPYFYVEDKKSLELVIPSSSYINMIEGSMVDGKFNMEQEESNAIFDKLQANSYAMIDHHRGVKVSINYDDVYQYMVLWAQEGKPFICIEPWMAPVDGMNVGVGIQHLQADQTHRSIIRILPQLIS